MLSTNARKKSAGKMRSERLLAVLLVPVVALIVGAAAPQVLAWGEPFEDAKIIFETNFSDEDTGIQIFLDGGPWKEVEIVGPKGEILEVEAEGRLRNFGLTEAFFESNEPNWDEVPLAEVLHRFPEGNYRFKGRATDGTRLRSRAYLSHDLPCAPEIKSPVEGAVVSDESVVINWWAVENKLDNDDQECSEGEIDIDGYQVIVENLNTEKQLSIFLEAKENDENTVTLPEEFVTPNSPYKFEVLAIAENGNQTIVESWFCTNQVCAEPE